MANKYPLPNVNKPPVEGRTGKSGGLGDKLENALTRFLQRVVLWSLDFIGDLLVDVFDNAMKILQPGMERMDRPLVDYYKGLKGLPPELLKTIEAIDNERGESKVVGAILRLIAMLTPFVTGGLAPLGRYTGFVLDYQLRTARPSPSEAVAMLKRKLITRETYEFAMGQVGVNERFMEALESLYDTTANPQDIIFGYMRGLYGEGELKSRLADAGVSVQMIDVLVEQSKALPPIQDILRMMVKEAFNESAIQQYGLHEDYPADASEHAARQGLSEEWTKAYWAAHWQLPSPDQVFEMWHRGAVTEGQLDDYLKFADYSPFWREKMKTISHTLLTRVDIRRAYQVGKLTPEQVKEQYRKRGYDETDADILTAIAIEGVSSDEKDLTRSDAVGLYVDGLQSRDETKTDIVKIGYDEDEAEDILKRADYDVKKKQKTDAVNYIEERYKLGAINAGTAKNELAQIPLTQIAVDRYVLEWDRQLEASVAVPTISEANRFFISDTITEGQFRDVLKRRNYDPEYIEWFVKDAIAKKDAANLVA